MASQIQSATSLTGEFEADLSAGSNSTTQNLPNSQFNNASLENAISNFISGSPVYQYNPQELKPTFDAEKTHTINLDNQRKLKEIEQAWEAEIGPNQIIAIPKEVSEIQKPADSFVDKTDTTILAEGPVKKPTPKDRLDLADKILVRGEKIGKKTWGISRFISENFYEVTIKLFVPVKKKKELTPEEKEKKAKRVAQLKKFIQGSLQGLNLLKAFRQEKIQTELEKHDVTAQEVVIENGFHADINPDAVLNTHNIYMAGAAKRIRIIEQKKLEEQRKAESVKATAKRPSGPGVENNLEKVGGNDNHITKITG